MERKKAPGGRRGRLVINHSEQLSGEHAGC